MHHSNSSNQIIDWVCLSPQISAEFQGVNLSRPLCSDIASSYDLIGLSKNLVIPIAPTVYRIKSIS